MKVTLDISFRDFAEFAGIKYVTAFRLFKDGRFHELETAFETKVKQMRNKGETVPKCKSVTISDKAFENETNVKQTCNKGETLKEQETKERTEKEKKAIENVPPAPPLRDYKENNKDKKENKEKEKTPLLENIDKSNFPEFPKGNVEQWENSQCFTEKKKETDKASTNTFFPPTIAEVQNYIDTKGYHVDAEQFCAFYESKGWYVGKNKMKNWRMAVVTWEKTHKKDKQQNSYSYGTGYNRTNPWSNRRTAPVIASSAKDYEGRF